MVVGWDSPFSFRDHVVDAISRHTVGRWLAADAIKPWQTRSLISVRDPCFAERAGVVLDLDDRHWYGEPLGANDFVISADEKRGIQALRRLGPVRPYCPAVRAGSSSSTTVAAP